MMRLLTLNSGCQVWHRRLQCHAWRLDAHLRWLSSTARHNSGQGQKLETTRNIGIIAHIDAVGHGGLPVVLRWLICQGKNHDHRAHALLQWCNSSHRRYVPTSLQTLSDDGRHWIISRRLHVLCCMSASPLQLLLQI